LIDRSSLVPAGTVIRGDLVVEANVVIGVGVVFGAGAAIGQGVVLPDGIVVEPGARIDMLKLHGCTLPPGTRVGGNLWLGAHCLIGRGIRFGGDNRIGPWLDLPDHLHIARGAQIRRLMLNNVRLPPGTVVSGDICLSAGVKIGRGVTFKAAVTVMNGATIPDGVTVGGGAVVRRCDVQGAQLGPEVWIRGDLRLKPGVQVGAGVEFDDGVVIHCICNIPDGVVFVHGAQVRHFHIAPGVFVPGGTRVAGNLRLGSGVSMAPNVFFNADVLIGEDVHIPAGARIGRHARIKRLDIAGDVLLPRRFTLHGDVSIGPGARIGCGAKLGADVEIGPGVVLPPNVALDSGARLRRLSIADGVTLPSGTRLGGDLVLRRGVQVGRDVAFGPGVDIGPHVVLPDGASVAAGVRLRELRVATDVELPLDTRIEGNLVLCAGVKVKEGACFGADVRVEADCRIGRGVRLPAGMVVEEGADVSFLDIAADVSLPCGTHINGNLRIGPGVRVGSGVCFGGNVEIGPGVQLPDGAIVIANACIERLAIAGDAVTGEALILCGNAVIEAGARLEDDVLLGADVIVGAAVHLPAGAVLANHARVRALRLGSDIELPAHFVLSGDLCLGDRVVVGGGVRFGAGVVVGAGAVIGEEAVLEDGAVVEAGAQVPPHARIAAPAPPVKLPGTDQETVDKPATASGLPVSPAMTPQPLIPPGDAPFPAWQAYLSAQAPTSTTGVEQHDDSQAGTPAQSPPVAIPATYRQPLSRAFHALPWRPPG
jgi:UDP-3-O-[3-hydroxymyristoyl] glucosamine N-acyltransferase